MDFKHAPVLFDEVMEALRITPGGIYIDGTVGGAGHSEGICQRLKGTGHLIAVDRDAEALDAAKERLKAYDSKKTFLHANFDDVTAIAEAGGRGARGILLDIGVSSYQLDNPGRGFSYMQDAPLDMRMDGSGGLTAYDVVNGYPEEELSRIIREYGEERWAARIAEFIARERKKAAIASSSELTEIIKAAIPASARRSGPHPAKRTFQAIRIEVNDELNHLREAVRKLPDLLESGGRIAVISFHSLEDRIVKTEFEKRLDPCTCPKDFPVCVCGKKADVKRVTKKPIEASAKELEINPRARSAKLRVLEKI